MYKLDLHIHSDASKCFKNEGLTTDEINYKIIEKAKEKKLDAVGIVDHYSIKNYEKIRQIGENNNIVVFPGLEFSLKTHLPEKVSIVILFDQNHTVTKINNILNGLNIPEDEYGNGYFLLENDVSDLVGLAKENNGIIMSSHQDKNESRMSYVTSLIEAGIKLFDLRHPEKRDEFKSRFMQYNIIPLTFSDAHRLENIGKYFTEVLVKPLSFFEIKKYFESL